MKPELDPEKYKDTVQLGTDGLTNYVSRLSKRSKKDKNEVYKWYKITWKTNAEAYHNQFPDIYKKKKVKKYQIKDVIDNLNKIKKRLKNVKLLYIRWKNVYDFIDNAWDVAIKKVGDTWNKDVIFYTENRIFDAQYTGILDLQWNLSNEKLELVNKIMKEYFGERYIAPIDTNQTIQIKLLRRDK